MGKATKNTGLQRGRSVADMQKANDVNGLVKAMSTQLAAALPKHVQSDRFARICMTTLRKQPKLMKCETASLLGSLMECSQLGLEPGVGQQVHLIPYGKEVQVIIGYQGYVELARRAGVTIHPPRIVREGDYFEVDYGAEREIVHKPEFSTLPLTHVWAKATWSTGDGITTIYEAMSRAEVEKVMHQALDGKPDWLKKKSPWNEHFEAMAQKTVVRRLAKYTPKSAEYIRAEAADGAVVSGFTAEGAADILLETEADVVEEPAAE